MSFARSTTSGSPLLATRSTVWGLLWYHIQQDCAVTASMRRPFCITVRVSGGAWYGSLRDHFLIGVRGLWAELAALHFDLTRGRGAEDLRSATGRTSACESDSSNNSGAEPASSGSNVVFKV